MPVVLNSCTENHRLNEVELGCEVKVTPMTSRLNLHDLEAIRVEMARVYRAMRSREIPTQDGTRLIYVLGELRKIFESCDLEKRLQTLEAVQ